MTEKQLKKLISDAGGTALVSRECKITSQAVSQWRKVPDIHCRTVSKLSGWTVYKIRPDIFGESTKDLDAGSSNQAQDNLDK